MTILDDVSNHLIAAKDPWLSVTPGWGSLIKHRKLGKVVKYSCKARGIIKAHREGKTFEQIAANEIASKIAGKAFIGPISAKSKAAHIWASHHSGDHIIHENGKIEKLGEHQEAKGIDHQRTWISTPGRKRMVIVYHEADKAGAHIDVHIDQLSVIYRVKPDIYAQLKFNKDGSLTNNSKELLIQHVRNEIANGSRVPQNLDHPEDQAVYSWLNHKDGPIGYGAGASRQVISISEVDIYKAYEDGPIEFFAPAINPRNSLYLYKIYHGKDGGTPICIWGEKHPTVPEFKDRLHLKMVDPADLKTYQNKLDMSTCTAKYDGSSVYLEFTPKSTRAWSPRVSKRTGERIEYTPKINGVASLHVPERTLAMGELMFYRETRNGKKIWLDHATSGGILNSHDLIPEGVKPMIVIYRVDRVGRKDTSSLTFWEQRQLAEQLVALDPENLMLPEIMSPAQAKKRGFEGVVICKPDSNLSDAVKTKYWLDADDWEVTKVDFSYSEKGNVQGVVWFKSLESGKKFKLGPGGIGDRTTCEAMMANPDNYVGAVAKVRSRHGHEGRASKLESWHDDKGFAIL